MAAPAKLEFDSWIETVRKHIELSDQSPHTGRPNFHRGKRTPPSESIPVQEALESLKSLHEELVVRAAAIEPTSPFNEELAQHVSNQVAAQVVSTLTAQLAHQFSDQFSTLLEEKLKQLDCLNSLSGNQSPQNSQTFANRIAVLENQLTELQSSSQSNEEQLRQSSDEYKARLAAVQEELALAYETIALLEIKSADRQSSDGNLEQHREAQPMESAAVAELEAEIESLRTTLAAVRSNMWEVSDSSPADLAAEVADLKQRNLNLVSQLAEAQSSLHNPPHLCLTALNQESMTWEQRKKLIMQQFEDESAAENYPDGLHGRIDIAEVMRTTQAEIERRDKEIAELKSIVEQQSNTREGVAIGAAAIAQMLDSDELVQLERAKLATIQREWEGKLREAELQFSTERAKLSRERAELDAQARQLAEQIVNLPAESKPTTEMKVDGKPVRRWLEHLGLRDK